MKKMPTGVRFVGTSIEVNFQAHGRRIQTTLPLPQTIAGIKSAVKIREDLKNKAKLGLLTEEDLLEAKGKPAPKKDTGTFDEYVAKYLAHCRANGDTATGYRRMVEHKWLPVFTGKQIQDITTADLREAIDDFDFASAKTKNNNLIPLRGVFEIAHQAGAIDTNPMNAIKNDKVQEDDPDPFAREEAEAIIEWLKDNVAPTYANYYQLAFFTGCRPSELLALHWCDVDTTANTMLVHRSRVRGVEKKVTKTHKSRLIHLNERARSALIKLHDITGRRDHVFICPETDRPFFNEKPPRVRFKMALDALGIRPRRAYNTRHTYATLMLTSGVTPFFASDQLGHSLQMMLKRYAKWIDTEKSKAEIAKLNL